MGMFHQVVVNQLDVIVIAQQLKDNESETYYYFFQ